MKNSFRRMVFDFICLLGLMLAVSGCDPAANKGAGTGESVASTQPTKLKMVVIDDPEFALETHRRWAAEGRFELVVETSTEQEMRDENFVVAADVDLLVMPAALETEFMTAGQLIEVPASTLESPGFSQAGLLGHFRGTLGTINQRQYSLPLGAPQTMLLVHEKLARREGFSAQSWESVNQALAVDDNAPEANDTNGKIVYPDSEDWLAWSLLARAASKVRATDDRSVLFVIETLEPLIGSPGFVEALEKMRDEAAPLDPQVPRSPADVFRMVAEGKAMAGLGWPSAHENPAETAGSVYASRLPGSARRYSRKRSEWIERRPNEQQQFDLLGVDGRCVGVTTASLFAGTSMELAVWMSNQSSTVLCPRSVASGPFRKSHLVSPNLWLGISMAPEAERQWSSEIEASHAALLPVAFPPLAGREEYLDVLAGAVRSCLANEKSPEDALSETAAAWVAITEKYGIEKQKARIRWRGP